MKKNFSGLLGATILVFFISTTPAKAKVYYDYADALMHEVINTAKTVSEATKIIVEEIQTRIEVVGEILTQTGVLNDGQREISKQASNDNIADIKANEEITKTQTDQQLLIERKAAVLKARLESKPTKAIIEQCLNALNTGGSVENVFHGVEEAAREVQNTLTKSSPGVIANVLEGNNEFCPPIMEISGSCGEDLTKDAKGNIIVPDPEKKDVNLAGASTDAAVLGLLTKQNTLSDKEKEAARLLQFQIISGKPLAHIVPNSANTQETQAKIVNQNILKSRLSVSSSVLLKRIEEKSKPEIIVKLIGKKRSGGYKILQPEDEGYSALYDQMYDYADKIAGYDKSLFSETDPRVSWSQVMDINARRRHQTPDWASESLINDTATHKETARMLAQLLYQQWESHKVLQEISTLLATNLATDLELHK